MAGWTDEQNDAIVVDYFAMLAEDLAGRPYSKAAHNRTLQAIIGRPRGSIEYKHQNISAVLLGLGETWIDGYKPAFNFQTSLEDAVARWLVAPPGWLAPVANAGAGLAVSGVREDATLWIGPPPTHSNAPPPKELEKGDGHRAQDLMLRNATPATARSGALAKERILAHERATLMSAGRRDLARRVEWVTADRGDGAGFDIASFTTEGRERLIEVKTTNGWERTPFHISPNELAVADARRDDWYLVRLFDFARKPRAFELRPPLDAHVALTPTSFQASFH